MPLKLVQTRIHLSIIERLRALSDRFEQKWFRVQRRIHTQNIQHDPRRSAVISTSNNITVANNKDKFAFIVIVQSRERVNRAPERVLAFGVTRHLTKHKLVLQLGLAFGAELESRQD